MKRKDCFFGLHFDYHAGKDTEDIGKLFDDEILDRLLREVKPDFVQCDSKGHPGISSYPTKVGNRAKSYSVDILKKWREITQKHGVNLYVHYSGIWDATALPAHPEWAAINKNGDPTVFASVFGEYVDKLLIPQLKEVALDYGIDGAWVDGECWALQEDYSKKAEEAWQKRTGKKLSELDSQDRLEYLAFLREYFYKYVTHYIEEVKKVAPDFEITSNWLNTAFAPDIFDLTDFTSGDTAGTPAIENNRFDARVIASFGKSWDLMGWGISHLSDNRQVKSAVQLCQEAASVISLGGAFQFYTIQDLQGVICDDWAISQFAEVAKFCRDRQKYCHKGEILPDIGVIYSVKAHYSQDFLMSRNSEYNNEMCGVVNALCDTGASVSIIHSQRIDQIDLSAYSMLVVSDLKELEKEVKERILAYLREGGKVLFFGKETCKYFADDLGLCYQKEGKELICKIKREGYQLLIRRPYLKISRDQISDQIDMQEYEADVIGSTMNDRYILSTEKSLPAFMTFNVGKGLAGALPITTGAAYLGEYSYQLAYFIRECLNRMGETKLACDKPRYCDVIATTKCGKEYIHLINLLGEHRTAKTNTFDQIPPLTGVTVTYKTEAKPKGVISRPDGQPLDFEYADGKLKVKLDVDLYTILEIEY